MKRAFTIIEMLIVIMLIGILASITVTSYNKTRQAAQLSLLMDKFVSDLREMKTDASNASNKCIGFEVQESGKIINIEADYENPFTKCNVSSISSVRNYSEEDLKVVTIKRQNISRPLETVQVLFTPPRGEVFVPGIDAPGQRIESENLVIELGLGNKVNAQQVLINRKNGSIQKIFTETE